VLKQLKQEQTFGELALLYNVKRTATISCTHSGILWALGEKRFRQAMKGLNTQQRSRVKGFLSAAPSFSCLSAPDRGALAEAGTVQVFQKNEVILREGEVGDWMFIIMDGTVQVVDQQGNVALRQPGASLVQLRSCARSGSSSERRLRSL
jgi:CRP-like cAMP-binding protein